MAATLTYYIFESFLVANVDGKAMRMKAVSGGGGGSKLHPGTDALNNPYMEGLRTSDDARLKKHVHGGPIPPGLYQVKTPGRHGHLGLCAQLAHPLFKPMGRDAFYIHATGPHGSDGCIVPTNPLDFQGLMGALTKSKGGVLLVEESVEGFRFG